MEYYFLDKLLNIKAILFKNTLFFMSMLLFLIFDMKSYLLLLLL